MAMRHTPEQRLLLMAMPKDVFERELDLASVTWSVARSRDRGECAARVGKRTRLREVGSICEVEGFRSELKYVRTGQVEDFLHTEIAAVEGWAKPLAWLRSKRIEVIVFRSCDGNARIGEGGGIEPMANRMRI